MGGLFDVVKKSEEIKVLENEVNSPTFWEDIPKANEINAKLSYLKKELNSYCDIEKRIQNTIELLEILNDTDTELQKELELDLLQVQNDFTELENKTLLSGLHDNLNCFLEIHSGAGGTESCDWVSMLFRMYQMFCEKYNFKLEILDEQRGEEAGYKSISLLIKGINSYGYFKCEHGVHRLVRISPFDSGGRRHTSFASVTTTPEFDKTIELDIKESDLKIDVYRSSGAGGQHVNTTDSAVRITHLPTKTVVTCQNERSQIKNKEQAMTILKSKLYKLELDKQEDEINKIKGKNVKVDFGSQIRSYVLEPYKMIKDHRSQFETANASKVLDGHIMDFIESVLKIKE